MAQRAPGLAVLAGEEPEQRLHEILETLQSLARLDFTRTARVSGGGDLLDALAAGVNMLGEELSAFQQEVDERAQALSVANVELTHRALYDSLTGLANRATFRDRLTETLAGKGVGQPSVAVISIDLDGFKEVNDSLGHGAGDTMLVEVGRRLEASVEWRQTAARVGGDEFGVLLPDASEVTALALAEEIAGRMREPFDIGGQTVRISASVGVALGRRGEDAGDLLRDADVALYTSKAARGGRPHLYVQGMHDPVVHRLKLSSALRAAVENKDLRLAYQPIVHLGSRSIVGFEALARWHDADLGTVPPGVFIPLAEEIGVMSELGDWVLGAACREVASWGTGTGSRARPYIAVNLSARQLQDDQLPDRVDAVLAQTGLPAERLMLEVTESKLVEHMADAVDVLGALRRRGSRIAIDDFGTGYSSLSYLRRLPVDIVKIDRAFVAGIGTDSGEWAFAQAVVRLVHRMGLTAVAEGVEDAAQLAHARAIGCEMAQGYYFDRPGDAASARALLAAQDSGARSQQRSPSRGTKPSPLVAASSAAVQVGGVVRRRGAAGNA